MSTLKSRFGRFVLRPLDPERDGPALHAIFGDEDSCRYMSQEPTASAAETIAALKTWQEGTAETTWSVAARADGPALGRISLIPRGRDIWEAACMIAPEARGRNLAERSLALAIDHVFAEKAARRFFADIDPDNSASIKTFQNLGFQYEGRLRANWKTHIGVRDSIIMSLIDADQRPWLK